MKKAMKKLMAALLAVAMVCAMAIPAWAAGGTTAGTGSITIDKAVSGETYTIYKMFDLNSYDPTAGTYSYTVVSAWEDFFKDGAAGNSYITLENGHPTWVKGAQAADFAKAALAYATEKNITATKKETATSNTVSFTGLDLGYYLVDTSLGALCGLDTTKPNAIIDEKNEVPTIDKKVKGSDGNWVTENTAKIGDTVEYKAVITVKTANTNYVMHDTMTDGLTFNKDSVKVTVSGADVPTTKYTLSAPGTKGGTFSIAFDNNYIASLSANTKIEVTYNAVVNKKAKIDPDANENEAYLTFGNSQETAHDKTYTYLYQFDLIKYSGSTKKLLGGAQFKLYDAETGGNEIKLVKNEDDTYRVATATETPVAYIETVAGKTVKISGLDKKVYYLEETVPPAGYNGLTQRVKVDLSTGTKKVPTGFLSNGTYDELNASSIGGVAVVNNAGTTLPGTGGIGTTIFYVIGGGLMVAAAILLITKKRMENH